MNVRQISVFLENRAGRLAEVGRQLGQGGVNIRALALADTSDFGILRLICDDVEKAVDILRGSGHTVSLSDVLAVEITDQPGGLAQVLECLENDSLNVEYMYAFVEKSSDKAVVIFRIEEADKAVQSLSKAGISVLDPEVVYTL